MNVFLFAFSMFSVSIANYICRGRIDFSSTRLAQTISLLVDEF